MLDFISSVIIGALVSISGVILRYWDDITRSRKFLKPYKKFSYDAYTSRDSVEKAFYKDRKKYLRRIIGIALEIIGIIIIACAAIIYYR